MQSVFNYLRYPNRFIDACVLHFCQWLPDSIYIKLRYRLYVGQRLNLENPTTFQEKIQWLKLNDRNPEYKKMANKLEAKAFVSRTLGSNYVVPLLGVWDNADDIDWDLLPNQFVLKTNHAGGNSGVVVCHDKSKLDRRKTIKKLNGSLKSDIYTMNREWPYKDIEKKVFAEKLIETKPEIRDLPDYKWYCFGGEPKYCQVIQNRTTKETIDFFDTKWRHQEFVGLNPTAGPAVVPPSCPANLDLHIRICEKLSKGIPFVRIDLYDTGKYTYFGEMTFYPASGFGRFTPKRYDVILGKLIVLPGER